MGWIREFFEQLQEYNIQYSRYLIKSETEAPVALFLLQVGRVVVVVVVVVQ